MSFTMIQPSVLHQPLFRDIGEQRMWVVHMGISCAADALYSCTWGGAGWTCFGESARAQQLQNILQLPESGNLTQPSWCA